MIFNQWYVILESKELNKKKPLKLKRLNKELALWRDEQQKVCCIDNTCCHRGASLSCGKIIEGNLECPFHGFIFDKSGRVTLIPANGKNAKVPESMRVHSYETHEEYGLIWMWYGDKDKINSKPFFFSELNDMSFSGLKDNWAVHYSRAIENQLDVVHLPFVHKTSIGRGNKTLIHGPVVIRDKELITFYVKNVSDDGKTKALKPNELKDYKKLFHLQFHYPNIWQNILSDKLRIFAAFVPVDEDNTIIYIRYYQKLIRIPVLKQIMNFTGKIASIVILRQDKRVVINQIPKKTSFRMSEKLIPGDKPIIEYRKHRQELIEIANKTLQ